MFGRRSIRRLLQRTTPPRREEVSARYWRELNQLLAEGEISLDIARAVERDMFERAAPGKPRLLNDHAWQSILDGRRADLDRTLAQAADRRRDPRIGL